MLYYIKSPVITMFVASFCGTLLIYFNSIANLLFAYEWVSPVQLIVTAGNIAGAVIFALPFTMGLLLWAFAIVLFVTQIVAAIINALD